MRIVPVAALICSALLLQGCIGAALVGSAAVATKAATDPRSVGTQVDDGTLEARVSGQLNKDKDIKQQRIVPVAYQGKVLLIGQLFLPYRTLLFTSYNSSSIFTTILSFLFCLRSFITPRSSLPIINITLRNACRLYN